MLSFEEDELFKKSTVNLKKFNDLNEYIKVLKQGNEVSLISRMHIKKGTTILKELPKAAVVNEIYKNCSNCFKDVTTILRCSVCNLIVYCSKECQLQDWTAFHKEECEIFKKLDKALTPSLRLNLRLLINEHKKSNSLKKLKSHKSDRSEESLETFAQMSMLLLHFVKSSSIFDENLFHATFMIELFCKVSVNSHTIVDNEQASKGLGLYLNAAKVNHSCDPNSIVIFHRNELSLRTVKDVEAGEEINITYIEVAEPFYVRQENLKESYFFSCNCTKCISQSVFDKSEKVKCPNCKKFVSLSSNLAINEKIGCECNWQTETFQYFRNKKKYFFDESKELLKLKDKKIILNKVLALINEYKQEFDDTNYQFIKFQFLKQDLNLKKLNTNKEQIIDDFKFSENLFLNLKSIYGFANEENKVEEKFHPRLGLQGYYVVKFGVNFFFFDDSYERSVLSVEEKKFLNLLLKYLEFSQAQLKVCFGIESYLFKECEDLKSNLEMKLRFG
ncbi:SET and MYND domain-containing protein 3 [Lobulomyces angularis]|nr:SET and MYND domain-containing protein 3 [Lobulomyces angularis]